MSPVTVSPAMRCLALTGLALLLQAQAPAEAGAVLDRLRDSGKIRIAHRESSVPFSYLDAQGRPVGYAVDLCLRLAETLRTRLGLRALTPEFVQVTPANRIQTVAEGRADMECGSTTNNAERRKSVAFTVPHYIAGARYAVRADSEIRELSDFAGKRLVSTKGTTPMSAVDQANRSRLLGITLLEAPDHSKALEMVEAGQADGFVMDDVLLYGLIAGRPDPSKLKVVGKFLTIEPLAIMLSPGDAEFKKIIDDEMRRLILSRDIYPIYDRWFQQPIPPGNVSLQLPPSYLLRDFWKYPSDKVPF